MIVIDRILAHITHAFGLLPAKRTENTVSSGCGICVQYCQKEALSVREGKIVMDDNNCLDCGTCVRFCIYGILESKPVSYRITLGGKRGRHPKVGMHLIIDWIYRYARFDTPIVQQIGHNLDIEEIKTILQEKLPEKTIAT